MERKHARNYYFHISQGLRGCYLPDNAYIVKVKTRRELKEALESEAYYIRDAGFIGCSRRAIAWLASATWKVKGKCTLDYVAPYKNKGQSGYPYGIFCSPANKEDYKEYMNSDQF